jgi:hypothetical protein
MRFKRQRDKRLCTGTPLCDATHLCMSESSSESSHTESESDAELEFDSGRGQLSYFQIVMAMQPSAKEKAIAEMDEDTRYEYRSGTDDYDFLTEVEVSYISSLPDLEQTNIFMVMGATAKEAYMNAVDELFDIEATHGGATVDFDLECQTQYFDAFQRKLDSAKTNDGVKAILNLQTSDFLKCYRVWSENYELLLESEAFDISKLPVAERKLVLNLMTDDGLSSYKRTTHDYTKFVESDFKEIKGLDEDTKRNIFAALELADLQLYRRKSDDYSQLTYREALPIIESDPRSLQTSKLSDAVKRDCARYYTSEFQEAAKRHFRAYGVYPSYLSLNSGNLDTFETELIKVLVYMDKLLNLQDDDMLCTENYQTLASSVVKLHSEIRVP